jgi:uncharacterized membrane protein
VKTAHALNSVFLLLALLTSFSNAGIVEGRVFDGDTLAPVSGASVSANDLKTGGAVVRVTTNSTGDYWFGLATGTYEIRAERNKNGTIEQDEVNVTILDNAEQRIDLVLFPEIGSVEQIQTPPELNVTNQSLGTPREFTPQPFLALAAIALAIITAAAFFTYVMRKQRERRKRAQIQTLKPATPELQPPKLQAQQEPQAPQPQMPSSAALREDLEQAMKIIRENDGRLTQKELRKAMNVSEAKASLVVAELEERGFIQKIKKGRGNVLKLP